MVWELIFGVTKKIREKRCMFACVKEIGHPFSMCIFSYFILSFYLNLIQIIDKKIRRKEIKFHGKVLVVPKSLSLFMLRRLVGMRKI